MQTIKLDISQKNNVPLLYVKQRDVGHKFAIELYENGALYPVNEGNTFSVWYSGASGDGNYTEIDGKPAVFVDGNHIEVQMIMQMLNEPGGHEMCVVMYGQDNKQKGFWNIPYYVEAIPGADSDGATAYYNAFLKAQEKAEEAADRAEAAADRAESAGGGSGGGTIIVGIDEGNTATHTASEIYDAIQNEQTVVFHYTGRLIDEFVPLKISKPDLAVFSKPGYPTEFDIFDIEIDNSGTISYNTHFSSDLVNQAVEKVETDLAPVSCLPQTLTDEQKAQARENIGAVDETYVDDAVKGKAYELIKTITFTEDSALQLTEIDGIPIKFSRIMLLCEVTNNQGIQIYFGFPGTSSRASFISWAGNTAKQACYGECWMQNGFWRGEWSYNTNFYVQGNIYRAGYNRIVAYPVDYARRYISEVYSESIFPAGTVLKIYAVRYEGD